ncbi:MAG: ATP-binding cassette domain-containing protein [Defluviitaleaceae bacterium]|nr:ATP-binding cassette domain-containing protein [Defluviitaleaceae bacterium]
MELRIESINKSFGTKQVLKDVSFSVQPGEAMGYLGRNGAGKTTTIRILTDIFRADSGDVSLGGKPIDYNKVRIGYLPEERGLYPKIKVGEQMIYIGELRGMRRADARKSATALLKELEAEEYWGKKLETLSKGNQQKIQLAIAVLHDPDIVILDEPFSGLDPVNASILKRLIMREVQRGKLVLFSSHQMPYVEEFCEHICIINQGEIVLDGRIRDIKRTYPRNRISILPEGRPEEFFTMLQTAHGSAAIISEASVAEGKSSGAGIEVTLKSAADKADLFKILAALPMGCDRVEVIEPTLEEIFVEKAGDIGGESK